MRIAIWSTGYCRGFGGTEQMVNALLRRFYTRGLETSLIADSHSGKENDNPYFAPLPDQIELYSDSFPNPLLNGGHPWAVARSLSRYFKAALRLRHFLRRRTPDIVHLHLVNLDVFLLIIYKYLFRYRLVITFRGGDLTVAKRSWLGRMKVRIGLRCADAVTSVSQQMADCIRDDFQYRNVLCIPNGIDHHELRSAATRLPPVVPQGHFIYAGRLHPDKRVPLLVEIFRECVDAGMDRNLYIIGDGEECVIVADYIARYRLEERIVMLGAMSRDKLLSVLSGARCLLLASGEEGCPNIVLEAMGLGIPVVAANVGGVPELVRHGQTGYLFPPNQPWLAKQYILLVARDFGHAHCLGQRGAELALKEFDLTETVSRYVRLYQSLLDDPESASQFGAKEHANV